ncbi:MAG: phosphoribosylglycinamide formyltransferase [Haliscomenobacter sp.]|nr:phosphoribosylglycinamide formyltransferase [Haliscomenobacter sp.]MBP9076180.1 phosphoribosylglycinamide formyltransferase [Haliscomenobacter sp.]MBP9874908.1 phosphoribosylglycinamide formyltransferase [Haliscomenobacter sp.]
MKNIAIFASGTGSNARKIMEYFALRQDIRVGLVVSNRSDAPVLQLAAAFHIPTRIIERQNFTQTEDLLAQLDAFQVEYIVLAGFLWKIPPYLVRRFEGRMLNIHPALLPKYGGKGMYGMHVHEAVRQSGDRETGITIHLVNERYDEGAILFQACCPVFPEDSPAEIAKNVQALEHVYFPLVVDAFIQKRPMQLPGGEIADFPVYIPAQVIL